MCGPSPVFNVDLDGRDDVTATVVVSLILLGVAESLVFIPFVPLMVHNLTSRGWDEDTAEDTVLTVWTVSWSLGESTGKQGRDRKEG